MYMYMHNALGLIPKESDKYNFTLDGEVFENISLTYNETIDVYCVGNLALAGLGDDTGENYLLAIQSDHVIVCTSTAGEHTVSLEMISPVIETIHKLDKKYVEMDVPYTLDGYGDLEFTNKGDTYLKGHVMYDYSGVIHSVQSLEDSLGQTSSQVSLLNNKFMRLPLEPGKGLDSVVMKSSNSSTEKNSAVGNCSVALGINSSAMGYAASTHGYGLLAFGDYSHIEGHGIFGPSISGYSTVIKNVISHTPSLWSVEFILNDSDNFGRSMIKKDCLVLLGPRFGSMLDVKGYYKVDNIVIDSTSDKYTVTAKLVLGDKTYRPNVNDTLYYEILHAGYAIGDYSHVEGCDNAGVGRSSHVEGEDNVAHGDYSHAEGYFTEAYGLGQHTQGKYNIIDPEGKYAHIVGNGTADDARSNAHTLDWNGNAWYAGSIEAVNGLIVKSSTEGSSKRFKITVDDSGTISATELIQ